MTYDVFDIYQDKVVLKNVSPSEVYKFLGVKRFPISNYVNMQTAYRSRYKFNYAEDYEEPPKKPTFRDEWLAMQKLFKNVKWAKEWEPGVYVVNERD